MKKLLEIEIDTDQACSLAQWDSVLGRRYCVHSGEYCEGDLTKRPSHCCLIYAAKLEKDFKEWKA